MHATSAQPRSYRTLLFCGLAMTNWVLDPLLGQELRQPIIGVGRLRKRAAEASILRVRSCYWICIAFVIRNNGLLETIRDLLTRCYLTSPNHGMEDFGRLVVCGPSSAHDIIRFGGQATSRRRNFGAKTPCRGFGHIVNDRACAGGPFDMEM